MKVGRGLVGHLRPDLLAQDIDRHAFAVFLVAPICPTIAAWRFLISRTDLVDRSFDLVPDKRAIGTDLGGIPAVQGIKLFARAKSFIP